MNSYKPNTTANKRSSRNKRKRTKHAALKPNVNLKIRYNEIADFDYLDKLNQSELEFLNKFVDGWVVSNTDNDMFPNKQELNQRNNARNRCIMSRARASNTLHYFSELKNTQMESFWDGVIERIDRRKHLKLIKKK